MCGTERALKPFGNRTWRKKSAGDKAAGRSSSRSGRARLGIISPHLPRWSVKVFNAGASKVLHEQVILIETELFY